ncbi:MAG: hypothetical protein DME26_06920 [Verrucomicrobia bacterium]|nr:MAG: hypothetical protein DME26_06920 [Verrucomicrobiota bacterium]
MHRVVMRTLAPERLLALLIAFVLAFGGASSFAAAEALFQVGVAKVDITPDYPIRLSGYGSRRTESDGVAQRIRAKALAISSDQDDFALLITVDNCGVPSSITEEVALRLSKKAGVKRERVAVCFSHSHTAPMLSGVLPNLFSSDIAPEQQATIERYTTALTDRIEHGKPPHQRRAGRSRAAHVASHRCGWEVAGGTRQLRLPLHDVGWWVQQSARRLGRLRTGIHRARSSGRDRFGGDWLRR